MRVKYFATYRDITGCKDEEIPAPGTVSELLAALALRHGKDMRARLLSPDSQALGPDAIVLVNGRNIAHLGMLDAPLCEADAVSIFPIVAGG
ncbi:MAG: MoaD family protein [Eggerthellaceae bacterium]|nr:MoaD family protein [Eggerthellaceae bacterium]